MYHDEFKRKPALRLDRIEDRVGGLAFELGGGLSLSLMASLDGPASSAIFPLGGLLPMVACSIGILAHRCSEALAELTRGVRGDRPSPMMALRGPRFLQARPGMVRAGFDHSRRLG